MRRDQQTATASRGRVALRVAAGLAALVFTCPAQAQNTGPVSSYRLPPKASPAPPPAAGPVDADHPAATPTRPAAEPSPAPVVSETPRTPPPITLPPLPARREPHRAPPAKQGAPAPREPADIPMQPATAAPETPLAPSLEPGPSASASAAESASAPEQPNRWDWRLPLGGALLLLVGGGLLWLRRKAGAPTAQEGPDEPHESAPAASAPAALTPIGTAPAARPARPAFGATPLELRFEPQSLRLSLVFATLSYRIALTNRGRAAIGPLRIAGDMISAHATVPSRQQLSPASDGLEPKHDLAGLGAGESVSLSGELRLPLEAVLAMRAGAAQLFAPLARFVVEAAAEADAPFSETRIYSLGQPSPQAGGAMAPFRLDHGPQLFGDVAQREVDIARWLPVDGDRRVG
jgi:hypothetical protein